MLSITQVSILLSGLLLIHLYKRCDKRKEIVFVDPSVLDVQKGSMYIAKPYRSAMLASNIGWMTSPMVICSSIECAAQWATYYIEMDHMKKMVRLYIFDNSNEMRKCIGYYNAGK